MIIATAEQRIKMAEKYFMADLSRNISLGKAAMITFSLA